VKYDNKYILCSVVSALSAFAKRGMDAKRRRFFSTPSPDVARMQIVLEKSDAENSLRK
jgi:hypothetical protein